MKEWWARKNYGGAKTSSIPAFTVRRLTAVRRDQWHKYPYVRYWGGERARYRLGSTVIAATSRLARTPKNSHSSLSQICVLIILCLSWKVYWFLRRMLYMVISKHFQLRDDGSIMAIKTFSFFIDLIWFADVRMTQKTLIKLDEVKISGWAASHIIDFIDCDGQNKFFARDE